MSTIEFQINWEDTEIMKIILEQKLWCDSYRTNKRKDTILVVAGRLEEEVKWRDQSERKVTALESEKRGWSRGRRNSRHGRRGGRGELRDEPGKLSKMAGSVLTMFLEKSERPWKRFEGGGEQAQEMVEHPASYFQVSRHRSSLLLREDKVGGQNQKSSN